jgi:hypothetical protein
MLRHVALVACREGGHQLDLGLIFCEVFGSGKAAQHQSATFRRQMGAKSASVKGTALLFAPAQE